MPYSAIKPLPSLTVEVKGCMRSGWLYTSSVRVAWKMTCFFTLPGQKRACRQTRDIHVLWYLRLLFFCAFLLLLLFLFVWLVGCLTSCARVFQHQIQQPLAAGGGGGEGGCRGTTDVLMIFLQPSLSSASLRVFARGSSVHSLMLSCQHFLVCLVSSRLVLCPA